MNLYALLDKASELFSTPFVATSDAMALRSLTTLLADPRTSVAKYPRDYSCWLLGSYEERTGHIITDKTFPKHVCELAVLLKEIENQNPKLPLGE